MIKISNEVTTQLEGIASGNLHKYYRGCVSMGSMFLRDKNSNVTIRVRTEDKDVLEFYDSVGRVICQMEDRGFIPTGHIEPLALHEDHFKGPLGNLLRNVLYELLANRTVYLDEEGQGLVMMILTSSLSSEGINEEAKDRGITAIELASQTVASSIEEFENKSNRSNRVMTQLAEVRIDDTFQSAFTESLPWEQPEGDGSKSVFYEDELVNMPNCCNRGELLDLIGTIGWSVDSKEYHEKTFRVYKMQSEETFRYDFLSASIYSARIAADLNL